MNPILNKTNFLTDDNGVIAYAQDVVAGREVAGSLVRASCARFLADFARSDIHFSFQDANRACRFFEERLTLADGQFDGLPFLLHPSQRFIISNIFGWIRVETGLRRFRRAYIEQGKGNGKSPMAAGIGLYCLMADHEKGAQVYAGATTYDQADILFQDAVRMVNGHSELARRVYQSGKDRIFRLTVNSGPAKGSFFVPIGHMAGKRGGSGPRPSCVLIDELHEHADRRLIDILERGFKFRRQPLLVMLTNSGFDLKSVCWEEREHAVRAAMGDPLADDTFSYVCTLDEKEDPFNDRSCWRKANPLLGTILTEEYLAGVAAQAKSIPGRRNNILRLHFCRWTDAETAWISREKWQSLEQPGLSIERFKGKPCRIGLDLSSRKDMSAAVVVFEDEPRNGKSCFAAFLLAYTPAATLRARAELDRAAYDVWVEQGYLRTTPGEVIKFSFIIADLLQIDHDYIIEMVAFDRHLIARFEEDMTEEGADFPLVEHPQGWNHRKSTKLWMPGSVQLLEDLISEDRLRVEASPVMRAAISGARFLVSPAELKRFDKSKATQRIDPLIALTQAIGAWGLTEVMDKPSVWEIIGKEAPSPKAKSVTSERPKDFPDDDDNEQEYR
jgi:phage terminase large subunit-like protein